MTEKKTPAAGGRRVSEHPVKGVRLDKPIVADSPDNDPELFRGFRQYLVAKGRSARTVKDTIETVKRAARDLGAEPLWLESDAITNWLARPSLSQGSRVAYRQQFLTWFNWAELTGLRPENPMRLVPRPRTPEYEPRPITTGELERLLATGMRRKTRVMVLLALLAGLRTSEIAQVRGEDVDLTERTIRVVGKGRKPATLPLHPELVAAAYTMPRRGWWFPANSVLPDGSHVHGHSVSELITRVFRRAGIEHGGAHRLRHWYATELLRNGADVLTVQRLMRHSNTAMTARYVAIASTDRAAAIDTLQLPD